MVTMFIDNREVVVAPGATVLDAARTLGLDIPSLCHADGHPPQTSCMLCQVKLTPTNRFVPSCATIAVEGMRVESESQEVREVRRTGLELLLSDHAGDCAAPCQNTCPCHMDIPLMLRQVDAGELDQAIVTVKKDIALPAILGRVCPDICERTCRRSDVDSPAAICLVKQYVADEDLGSEEPYLPARATRTGKRVAIIGAGPTGLTAAYHLLQAGHACTLFDRQSEPGGMLCTDFDEQALPRSVLAGEVSVIRRLGAVFEMGRTIGKERSLSDLAAEFDAVLVAAGSLVPSELDELGLPSTSGRVDVNTKTHETPLPGVFAAGDLVQLSKLVVRSVAEGKEAAQHIDQFLCGGGPLAKAKPFQVRMGRLEQEEIDRFTIGVSEASRVTRAGGQQRGLTGAEVRAEAARCLHCDCGSKGDCRLRYYSDLYGANQNRFGGTRRKFERLVQLGVGETNVVFEPGKCILCGLCVQVATEACEPLGLTFVGRGFDVRVGVPFDRSMSEGLTVAARRCVDVCPTGALILRSLGAGQPTRCAQQKP